MCSNISDELYIKTREILKFHPSTTVENRSNANKQLFPTSDNGKILFWKAKLNKLSSSVQLS